eukprot:4324390-Prorocentrum_lima.AAC.1
MHRLIHPTVVMHGCPCFTQSPIGYRAITMSPSPVFNKWVIGRAMGISSSSSSAARCEATRKN